MSEACHITSIPQGKLYVVRIQGAIQSFEDYEELFDTIYKLTENDSLNICLNCPGGNCDIGFSIAHAILSAPCPVRVVVEYPTYSMGAIIAMCGDELLMGPNSYLMFHDYSSGSYGKGEETWLYTDNFRKMFKDKFISLCRPFLTAQECNKMFKGEDIYIFNSDPTLEQRLKRHFKMEKLPT